MTDTEKKSSRQQPDRVALGWDLGGQVEDVDFRYRQCGGCGRLFFVHDPSGCVFCRLDKRVKNKENNQNACIEVES